MASKPGLQTIRHSPGADLSHEELTVRVLPRQADEFTCFSCFLVKHRSQIAETRGGHDYCLHGV